jgi:hypothetical protein
MANLSTKIKLYANQEVDFKKDVYYKMKNGQGAYIKEWNLATPKPTLEQLNAFEAQATTYENNQKIIATRKALYGAWDKQLEEIYDNGIDSWKARIAQIKADHPKENNNEQNRSRCNRTTIRNHVNPRCEWG